MKYLISLFFLFFFTNCSENDCCTVIDLQVNLKYFNQEGEDLLNPDTTNHFSENRIKVYYLVNGEKKEIIRGNLDNPRMFSLSEPHSERDYFILSLSLNDLSDEKIKTTYLELNENDTDTITHTLTQSSGNNKVIDKVWYNGRLPDNEDWKIFKITKE
ncbi:hypothetical protein [Flagellimonas onchidii]|uniref:hypothetical protein n=1 Tax=Flagellimonas onchidii TaxID=2562684 RepID=UPI0010A5E29A|nr:hypothetical protein [Allomuricauda onchidii]